MAKCTKFGSKNTKLVIYLGITTIKCSKCGFDESKVYEVYPEEKKSQKAKGRYAVYKMGGSLRARKK